MTPRKWLSCGALGALLLSGCATYDVKVATERTAAALPAARTYVLTVGPQTPNNNPAFTAQTVEALKTALAHRGYAPAGTADSAAVAIVVTCDVYQGMTTAYKSGSTEVDRFPHRPMNYTGNNYPTPPPVAIPHAVPVREPQYGVVITVRATEVKTGDLLWQIGTSATVGPEGRDVIVPCLVAAAEASIEPTATGNKVVSVSPRQL